jgi:hypothetical protein
LRGGPERNDPDGHACGPQRLKQTVQRHATATPGRERRPGGDHEDARRVVAHRLRATLRAPGNQAAGVRPALAEQRSSVAEDDERMRRGQIDQAPAAPTMSDREC